MNSFATNDQCNVVEDLSSVPSVEGTWGNVQQDFDHIDFCVFDDDDEGHASFARVGINATIGYMTGQVMEKQTLFQGDYSAQNPAGNYKSGGVLFFPRSADEAVMFMWPGEQINQNGPHTVTTKIQHRDNDGARCEDNRFIVTPGYEIDSSTGSTSNALPFLLVVASMIVVML